MNILIIGLGSIAKKHIIAIKSTFPIAKIIALRSGMNKDSVDDVENVFSLNELSVKPDFAIISNSTKYHESYIIELLEFNIPIFIEKPSLNKLTNADELIRMIKGRDITTYVACNLRFHPCILYLSKYIKSNLHKINEVSVYCGSYLPEWRPNQNFRESYSSDIEMGGGVHLDLIHELDYSTWLFGMPITFNRFLSSKSTLKINSPDYANYILSYHSFNVSIILNYFRRDSKRTIEIVLDDSTTSIDLLKSQIINSKDGIIFQDEQFMMIDTYKSQLKYFVEKIRNKEKPMNSLEESIDVLKIAISNEST